NIARREAEPGSPSLPGSLARDDRAGDGEAGPVRRPARAPPARSSESRSSVRLTPGFGLQPLRLGIAIPLVDNQAADLALIILDEGDRGIDDLEEEDRLRLREHLDLGLIGELDQETISLASDRRDDLG